MFATFYIPWRNPTVTTLASIRRSVRYGFKLAPGGWISKSFGCSTEPISSKCAAMLHPHKIKNVHSVVSPICLWYAKHIEIWLPLDQNLKDNFIWLRPLEMVKMILKCPLQIYTCVSPGLTALKTRLATQDIAVKTKNVFTTAVARPIKKRPRLKNNHMRSTSGWLRHL